MTTRMIRDTTALVALLFGMLALAISPTAAQDATPSPIAVQPVTVGDTEITWTGEWQLDPASSTDQQVTLIEVDPATGSLKLATYGEFADDSVDSAEAALQTFTESFFVGAGVDGVQQVGSGELEDGTVWSLFSFGLQGLELSMLITVNEVSDNEFVVSTLTANTDNFEETIAQAQEEIMLDGEPAFLAGIDNIAVTVGAGASPVASPAATPAN